MPDSKKARNWRKVVRRTTVEWLPEGYAFFLPAHKADTAFEGNKVIIPTTTRPHIQSSPSFPSILSSQRRSASCPPSALWVTAAGSVPTRTWFMKKPATNIPRQENRRTIDASRGCYPISQSKACSRTLYRRVGRWSSAAFKIYIRKNPVILQALIDTRAPSI